MSVRIYVEGGGDQRRTLDACRLGFAQLFSKICRAGNRPKVIPAGGRRAAFDDFCTALKTHPNDFVMLLVDSEGPVHAGTTPWSHLKNRPEDGWIRPPDVQDSQAHLMVQCMEAWFLADREETAVYFGDGFLTSSLPGQPDVELVSKRDLLSALEHAVAATQKAEYRKTRDAFALLARIDPQKIRTASKHAERLFALLER